MRSRSRYSPKPPARWQRGRIDVSLVEGSITTAHDAKRIQQVRRQSKALVTIGACATAGGIQALRNFADVEEFVATVYASPQVHQDAGDLHADLRPRESGFRAAWLPDQQDAVAGGAVRVPGRPQAGDRRATASVSSASCVARPASWCRAHPASARSPMPAAARSALRITAAAMAASARWRVRTRRRWRRNGNVLGRRERDIHRVFRTFNAAAEPFRQGKRRAWRIRRSRST